jgi:hypothetical protein
VKIEKIVEMIRLNLYNKGLFFGSQAIRGRRSTWRFNRFHPSPPSAVSFDVANLPIGGLEDILSNLNQCIAEYMVSKLRVHDVVTIIFVHDGLNIVT